MNFVQVITLPSPRRPPLVLCAGDEGTPSPHYISRQGAAIPMNASTRRKIPLPGETRDLHVKDATSDHT